MEKVIMHLVDIHAVPDKIKPVFIRTDLNMDS